MILDLKTSIIYGLTSALIWFIIGSFLSISGGFQTFLAATTAFLLTYFFSLASIFKPNSRFNTSILAAIIAGVLLFPY